MNSEEAVEKLICAGLKAKKSKLSKGIIGGVSAMSDCDIMLYQKSFRIMQQKTWDGRRFRVEVSYLSGRGVERRYAPTWEAAVKIVVDIYREYGELK